MKRPERTLEETLAFRQVIPRWRSPQDSMTEILQHRVDQPALASKFAEHWLAEATQRYQEKPDMESATQLAEIAAMMGRDSGVQHPTMANSADRDGAPESALSSDPSLEPTAQEIGNNIRRARASIRAYPQQPFAWSELARAHISMGQGEKAKRAMLAALGGAPRNGYLLRAAARFFTLLDKPEPDRALWLLRKYGALEKHPHLLSAEIAISSAENLPTKHARLAAEVLVDQRFAPQQLAELAAAVGTVDQQNGKHKRAKARFVQSLIDPTENSLAQAYWASQQDSKIVIPDRAWTTPRPHEALALSSREAQDYPAVVTACKRWIRDQPFDLTPALLGSYYGAIPSLESDAEAIATAGLFAHPRSPGLLNNRAVARLYKNDIDGARKDIELAVATSPHEPHLIATAGLYAFRQGDAEQGRMAYMRSILVFKDKRDLVSPLLSMLHWLREEIRLGMTDAAQTLAELHPYVVKLSNTSRGADVKMIFDLVMTQATTHARDHFSVPPFVADTNVQQLFSGFKPAIGIPDLTQITATDLCVANCSVFRPPALDNLRTLLAIER